MSFFPFQSISVGGKGGGRGGEGERERIWGEVGEI